MTFPSSVSFPRLLAIPVAALMVAELVAAPYGPDGLTTEFIQPDGAKLTLRVFGDEFHARTETTDGHSVVFDPVTKTYSYAELSADDQSLLATKLRVGADDARAKGLAKHLEINRDAIRKQARERFLKWEDGMGVEARWKNLKAQQQALDRAADAGGPSPTPPSSTTTGSKTGLTLLIDFSDDPATVPQASIVSYCNGDGYTGYGNNGSVKSYFLDNSNNTLTYTNTVTAYIRMAKTKSYYNNTANDCGDQANEMIRDAITLMKALPNYASTILPTFSGLSVDGGNNVIACNVFYAGGNGGVWMYGLWPHSWSLYNVGAQELSAGGKKVFRYQVTNIGSSLSLGTFCHENGHMLCGFPDIYDYGYDSIGGAGAFCLMNSGGHGTNPSLACAYLKRAAGWAAATVNVTSASALTATLTAPVGSANYNKFYRYAKPGVATEYFLLENRQPTGRDAGLPASGIAVWHIDELGDKDDQRLTPNSTHDNYEVTLVQADNLWHFQSDTNSGDSKDLYYLGNTAAGYANTFTDLSAPHAHWWDGTNSGLKLRSFSASAASMTVEIGDLIPANTLVVISPNGGETFFQGDTRAITWNANIVGNVKIELFKGGVFNTAITANTANSGSYTWNIPPTFTTGTNYTVKVTSVNNSAYSDSSNANFEIRYVPSLAEALDKTDVVWVTAGNANWLAQTTTTHDGTDAGASGDIADNGQSYAQTTLTGPGTLTFWWKVSSESGWDYLRFLVDNVEQTGTLAAISGEVQWVQKTVSIPAGSHTVKWLYDKDFTVSNGQDAGFLDQVVYSVTTGPEIAVEQPAGTEIADGGTKSFGAVAVGANTSLTFSIRNTGSSSLTGLTVTKDGTNSADFTVTASPVAPVAAGGTTTLTVRFAPTAIGTLTAAIHIASNDTDENPYDLTLTGTGEAAEIAVEQPAGVAIADGGTKDYGNVAVGSNTSLVFTIRNSGNVNLTGLTLTKDGAHAGDFTVTANPAAPVAPAGTTTFTVRFAPTSTGLRTANLHLASNDPDENPYDLTLRGNVVAPDIVVEQPVGTSISDNGTKTFGAVDLGTTASLVFTIRNAGTANLTGLAMVKDGAHAADFTVTANPVAPVAPGGTTTFTVSFAPTVIGTRTAALHIASNDPDEAPFDLNLTGTGTSPEVVVEQPSGSDVPDGGTRIAGTPPLGSSASLTFTIRNTGSSNLTGLTITKNGIHAADFAITASPVAPVVAGGSTTFRVVFTPSASGKRTAAIHIASNDLDENPFDINLEGGEVLPPDIAVEQPAGTLIPDGGGQNFGLVAVGSANTLTFTIRNTANTGAANLTGLSFTADGSNPSEFIVVSPPVSSLAPGASTTFTVAFTPTQAGSRTRSAILHIASNDPDESPYDIMLGGTFAYAEISVEQPAGTDIADGGSKDFGPVAVGSSAEIAFRIANSGTANLTGLGITINGANASDFTVSSSPMAPVAAGGATSLTVRFAPTGTAAGTRTAAIHIASNDTNENPFDLNLSGTVILPEIAVEQPAGTNITDGGTKAFGSVEVLGNTQLTFTIKNTGAASLTGLAITKDGTHAADYTITANPAAPVSPSGTTTFTVKFAPSAIGTRTAALHIASNDADENPFDINLTGVGTAPEIAVEQPAGTDLADTGSRSFGSVLVNSNTSLVFTIKNTGSANLTGLTITKDGANAGDFTITANPAAPVTGPSGTTTFTVKFAPGAIGTRTAAIHIANNDLDENPYDISLTGVGISPEIAVEQPAGTDIADGGTKSFGAIAVGASASLTFTIRNTGTAQLAVTPTFTKDGAHAADFTVTTAPSASVAAGGTTTFIVRAAPSSSGTRTATIHITNSDVNENPFDINLVIEPPLVEIAVEQPLGTHIADGGAKEFGSVLVGSNTSLSFTIKNTGTMNLTGLTLTKDGTHSGDFAITSIPVSPVTGPTGMTTFTVRFAPTAAGTRTAAIHIASNDADENPFDITLTGTGIDPEIGVEQPAGSNLADGGSRNFGSTLVGANASLTFTIKNSGLANLLGVTLAKDGSHAGDFTITASPASTVVPGGATTFTVRFAPTAAGVRTAALHIASNDLDENPFDITLTGTAIAPEMVVEQPTGSGITDGGARDFGSVPVGLNTSLTFTISNIGTANLNGLTITKDGTHAAEFTVTASPVAPVAPAAATTFTVRFSPTAFGTRSATLHIANDDLDENPFDLHLTGSGLTLAEAVDATALPWTTGGAAGWQPQTAITHDGGDAGRSGAIDHNQESWMETTVSSPGTLSFWWKVSSEAGFDVLSLSIDGVQQAAISGTVDWERRSLSVMGAGPHILRWRYSKDGSVASGTDTGWLDQIAFEEPLDPEIVVERSGINIPDGGPSAFGVVPPGYDVSLNFTIRNTGSGNLTGLAISMDGANPGDFAVTVVPVAPVASGGATTFTVRCAPTAVGTRTATLRIASNDADESPFDIPLTVTALRLKEALDTPTLVWTTGGNGHWLPELTVAHDGTDAAQSGAIGHAQESWMETTVVGQGRVSFWWKVSSEAGWDNLRFTLDGVEQPGIPNISGNVDWSFQELALGPGTHVLRWRYAKDGSGVAGLDAGWVDEVYFQKQTEPNLAIAINLPPMTPVPDNGTIDFGDLQVTSWGQSRSFTFTISNTGDGILDSLVIGKDGTNPAEFTVTGPAAAALPPGGSTTFTVTFTPSQYGSRSRTASLHIASNDPDENPFDMDLFAEVYPVPDITIQQPAGTGLMDGSAEVNFGTATSGSRVFTVINNGTKTLNNLVLTKDGFNASDFSVGAPGATSVAAGASTTFTVNYTQGGTGPRTAAIHIASDDPDENPFDIDLRAGSGTLLEFWRQKYFGSPANSGNGADLTDFDKDGIPNLVEFAFGLHPKQNSAGRLPQPQLIGNQLVLGFAQPANVGGIIYGAEWSPTMAPGGWTAVTDTGVAPQHTFSVPTSGKTRAFMRFKIVRP